MPKKTATPKNVKKTPAASKPVRVDGVIDYRTKPLVVEAIQFTGKNGKDVVTFATSKDIRARNGGSYVHIFIGEDKLMLRKGMILSVTQDNSFGLFSLEDFKKDHQVPKSSTLV